MEVETSMRFNSAKRVLRWVAGASSALTLAMAVLLLAGCSSDGTPTPPTPTADVGDTPSPAATQTPSGTATEEPTVSPGATFIPSSGSTPSPESTRTGTPGSTTGPGPIPTNTPGSTSTPAGRETIPEAPDRDLYDLARALLLKSTEPIPRVVNPLPVSLEVGREDTFLLTDLNDFDSYTSVATLRLVTPHAYWYVEEGLDVGQDDLEDAAQLFEERIYPRVTAAFGTEWTPGVDNDSHMTILNARIKGVSGYFSSADEYPSEVHGLSNEREMFYLNVGGGAGALRVGSRGTYPSVLAHELQHAIHWNGDPTEETWVNEGLAELAASAAGYRPANQDVFLNSPTVSVVNWPDQATPYYGAAFLFFDYLMAHYGDITDVAALVAEPADGIQGIDAYLVSRGHTIDFLDVFTDWSIANYVDDPGGGPYSYPDRDVKARVGHRIGEPGTVNSAIPQYAAEYTAIDIIRGDVRLSFQGRTENALLPVALEGEGCWWGNRGDSISSTLTRPLDLSGLSQATLRFRTWFELEEDWDYGYVEVSIDGGVTWDVLPGTHSSLGNPVGNSFGPGYTGASYRWLQEEIDLSSYARREVLLRFHNVTDQALNETGICLHDVSVPEVGLLNVGDDGGWQADGFIWIDNSVPQDYVVHVIEVGDETRVRRMPLGQDNAGELIVQGLEKLDELVVVVAAVAQKTLQEARYTLTVDAAS